MTKDALYLIDAYGLIYRSYFAFLSRPLINPQGKNVSALFGFTRTLLSLIDEGAPWPYPANGSQEAAEGLLKKPLLLAAAFDSPGPTFRHKIYPEYKATRQKAPDDLHAQVPLVEELLGALGIPSLRAEGFEADDIIATLAIKCQAEDRPCFILSSDKDLLQLVGKGTWELRPIKMSDRSETQKGLPYQLVGPDEVKAEWGVSPDKVLDLLSLTGDSSDNIPGVKGVGEVTALKLMARYGSLDEIYKNLAGIEGAAGKKLAAGKESAFFSRSLIELKNEVPLPIKTIEELSVENLNRSAGAKVLLREGIRQSARQLDSGMHSGQDVPAGGGAVPSGSNDTNPAAGGAPIQADTALLGEGTYHTILDMKELEALLTKAKQKEMLALDFETDSLDAWNARPIGIALALEPKTAYYVPIAPHRGIKDGEMADAPFLDGEAVKNLLAPFFADPSMCIVAHNAKYDYKVSRGWGIPRWSCKIYDTMVAAWILEGDRNNYSLDSLSAFFFDIKTVLYKDIVPKGETFDMVSLETAARYAAEDGDLCLRLKEYLDARFKEEDRQGSFELFTNLEMPLLPILAEMEGEGILIDRDILKQYGEDLGKELLSIQAKTYEVVGHEFNLSSTQQLQKVLFEERKLVPTKKTKTGYSTDVAVLEELARQDEVPALILRHRTLLKLKSTYVDALPEEADEEGRVHTTLVQTGTATGRLSSREPNLQNIPIRDEEGRRIREAFIPKPGSLLISADYSQIELVVLAHLSQDANLLSAFFEGKDIHAKTASLIFGLDEGAVTGDQRRIAKTINFGVMYGMSSFRLANELGISRGEASSFIEAYFRTYSGVRSYIDQLIKKTEERGYVSTILGRRRTIEGINSRNKTEKAAAERIAVNTPIQGSAADIVKTAMLNLDGALAKAKSPAKLLLQVHDELILECPEDLAHKTAALMKDVMERAVQLSVPLRVNVEVGKRWGDFH
ncbi:MAG: DNA polymerase I [Treponema sp.]|nr:DNA polymerase I [Treponema sp.]